MTLDLIMTVLVLVQTTAILLLAHAWRADRRQQAATRLVAASWNLLDRFARDFVKVWSEPGEGLMKGLEREQQELNQSLAVALRYFRREQLNMVFAVKELIETVESDRLLYMAKQKPDAEPRIAEQVNVHFGPGTNPTDLLAATQRFREGIEEFQELAMAGYEMRAVLDWAKSLRDKLPSRSAGPLRASAASDSIAPGSP